MKGTRTLLSLAVGLALASSGAHAAFVCPSDPAQLTPIPTIQGTGSASALATQTVTDKNGNVTGKVSPGTFNVRGIVTTLGQSLTKGFYLTDPVGDGNPATSDGIFVYLNDKDFATKYKDIKPGAELCLEAKVDLAPQGGGVPGGGLVFEQALEVHGLPLVDQVGLRAGTGHGQQLVGQMAQALGSVL